MSTRARAAVVAAALLTGAAGCQARGAVTLDLTRAGLATVVLDVRVALDEETASRLGLVEGASLDDAAVVGDLDRALAAAGVPAASATVEQDVADGTIDTVVTVRDVPLAAATALLTDPGNGIFSDLRMTPRGDGITVEGTLVPIDSLLERGGPTLAGEAARLADERDVPPASLLTADVEVRVRLPGDRRHSNAAFTRADGAEVWLVARHPVAVQASSGAGAPFPWHLAWLVAALVAVPAAAIAARTWARRD